MIVGTTEDDRAGREFYFAVERSSESVSLRSGSLWVSWATDPGTPCSSISLAADGPRIKGIGWSGSSRSSSRAIALGHRRSGQ
ncbi:MAG: hypothetical protein JWN03_5294 [Nocardia sp.]|nr:hypothetical protein [Nocardia sp.]